MKTQLNEVQKLQKIAGILKEDFKVDSILNFKDGEVWRVTKVTPKGVLAKPHDEKTKKHNVSVEIEISNEYLEKHLK